MMQGVYLIPMLRRGILEKTMTHMEMHQSTEEDPCLLNTHDIFTSNSLEYYEHSCIEFKDIQSALRKYVSIEKGLPLNADINSLGRYKQSHLSTLMQWAKRHITQHAMMST